MRLQAIVFGGIGALVETSELQRRAFNRAFDEQGLAWSWDVATYERLLAVPGGANRIRTFAALTDRSGLSDERIRRLHDRKTAIYRQALEQERVSPRPGVRRLLDDAARLDIPTAIASTTSRLNIELLARAADIDLAMFATVLDRSSVDRPKPSPDVYRECLHRLDVQSAGAVAIEDSATGVRGAVAAHVTCVATPGRYTRNQNYGGAAVVLSDLGDPGSPAHDLHGGQVTAAPIVNRAWLTSLLADARTACAA